MQWPIVCFLLIGLICVIQGLRKSTIGKTTVGKRHCSGCGWTAEAVQFCQFDRERGTVIAPLCFECAMKREAIPVKALQIDVYREACA